MNNLDENGDRAQVTDDGNPDAGRWGSQSIAACICAILGTIGWLALALLLDHAQQSEQLARFFATFINRMMLLFIGIPSTLLLLTAIWITSRPQSSNGKLRTTTKFLAWFGFVLGGLVLLNFLPACIGR